MEGTGGRGVVGSAAAAPPIYADNNGTTLPSAAVLHTVNTVALVAFGNPSAHNYAGIVAREMLDAARASIAKSLGGVSVDELTFTSGATEANNTALQGAVACYRGGGRKCAGKGACRRLKTTIPHLVATTIEHASVYEPLQSLRTSGRARTTLVPVDRAGRVRLPALRQALSCPHTVLLVVIGGNNETGIVQNLGDIVAAAHARAVPVLLDATQLVGKYPVLPRLLGVDMLSCSAHKFHGPRGVGLLWAAAEYTKRVGLCPLHHGGVQEHGRRAGTENVPAIAGFAVALRGATRGAAAMTTRARHVWEIRELFLRVLATELADNGLDPQSVTVHSQPLWGLYNTASVSLPPYVDSRALQKFLSGHRISVNVGSACSKGARSRVLTALGVPVALERSALRVSLSEENSRRDVITIGSLVAAFCVEAAAAAAARAAAV